jgi:predicted nucleic acid-binding Zn ribbon protein
MVTSSAMVSPNPAGRCAHCDKTLPSSDGRRYCGAACRTAARRERGRSRARHRKRAELTFEVALLLVVNVVLGSVINLASTFAANAFLWAATGVITLVAVGLVHKRHFGRFFPRSRRGAVGISVLATVALVGTGGFELGKHPPSPCTPRSAADQGVGTDPRTRLRWPTVYECPTLGNGSVYKAPDSGERIATMFAERKVWVVCWVLMPGSGIWYYTQGDASLTEQSKRDLNAWGYLPHRSIDVRTHPARPVPRCRDRMP